MSFVLEGVENSFSRETRKRPKYLVLWKTLIPFGYESIAGFQDERFVRFSASASQPRRNFSIGTLDR